MLKSTQLGITSEQRDSKLVLVIVYVIRYLLNVTENLNQSIHLKVQNKRVTNI